MTSHTAAPNAICLFDDMRIVGAPCSLVLPGRAPCLPAGQFDDNAVNLAKRKAAAALLPQVIMEGESLETVYQFDYLGCRFKSDGDEAADMRH